MYLIVYGSKLIIVRVGVSVVLNLSGSFQVAEPTYLVLEKLDCRPAVGEIPRVKDI